MKRRFARVTRSLKAQQEAKDREMEKLYRKHVLGEKEPEGGFVPLNTIIGAAPKKAAESKEEEVGSFGD